jgi:hypothetical protein
VAGVFGAEAAKNTRHKQYLFLPVAFCPGRAKSDRQKG